MSRVLIVDDDPGLRQSLGLLLQGEGYEVVSEGSPARALERASSEAFDLILCDVRMPEMDGLEFLRRYREVRGRALVIMMSAYGGEDQAIAAMKAGAYDYIPKPFRSDEVILTLKKAEEREQLRSQVASLQAELTRRTDREVVAESPAMRKVMELASRVAPHSTTVLITGESGTGKEVVARAIHRMSPRKDRRFVAVNCGAIPENLLESELFGHARGAFTGATSDKPGLFEEADGGTLLLDEIGELPLELQVKLLRVLQEGEVRRVGAAKTRRVDVRVLAATARDLEADVRQGRFREDLYYRINVVRIHLPPLRQRPEDVEALARLFLEHASRRSGRALTLTPAAMAALKAHPWPGNVRELENALERAAVLSADGRITPAELWPEAAESSGGAGGPGSSPGAAGPTTLREALEQATREAIQRALDACGGNRAQAARLLGISQRALFYKLKQLKLGG
ncbi:MAG: acetoacetate metabolism regulatory protein AtoC [Gemmatimonadales bacterium]|nr:Transcriptional regulatory protein ZraR [bacterium HR33]GIW52649.1 MAG: acetoacetate metabolism regulatory protein AtoC [Gemmatimonadales bacterium]